MIIVLYFYIIGIILTGLYITAQLIIELPYDVENFKRHQAEGNLSADDSVIWFVVETLIVGFALSLGFPSSGI